MTKKKKNFYKLLDIKQDAAPAEIRKAYRSAAKRCHPDVSSENAEQFKQVQEAYETLSDPEKKIRYDEQLRVENKPKARASKTSIKEDSFFNFFDQMDSFAGLSNPWADFVSDFFFEEEDFPGKHYLEVFLSPGEAREGGEISLKIPMEIPCSRCFGTGSVGHLICGRCRGQGEEKLEKKFTVTIPPGVIDGTETRISTRGSNARSVEITAIIRVSPH